MLKAATSFLSVAAIVVTLSLTGCASDVMGPDLDPAASEVTFESKDAAHNLDPAHTGDGGTNDRGQSHNEIEGMD